MEVSDFVSAPSEEGLEACTKEQIILLAEHYQINLGDKRAARDHLKAVVKKALVEQQVLIPTPTGGAGVQADVSAEGSMLPPGTALTFEQQKELLNLQLQVQLQLKEKELEIERMRHKAEMAKLDVEDTRLKLMQEGKLSSVKKEDSGDNILNSLRLVPKFNEKEVDVFFTLFERVADARLWSDVDRTVLLQCVFTGRAQEAFASLSAQDSTQYQKVKETVLKAYELVPEAYRQRFRSWQRGNKSYMEFARDLSTHFNRWCVAAGVEDYDDLADLIVLEQFKNSVPEQIAVYICEQKAKTAAEAAALSDDYALTHKSCGDSRSDASGGPGGARVAGRVVGGKYIPGRSSGSGSGPAGRGGALDSDNVCRFCHKPGHWKKECPALRARKDGGEVKPAAFAASLPWESGAIRPLAQVPGHSKPESSFLPFVSKGYVSLIGNPEKVPITILRDTGAFDSFILSSALPFSEETHTGSFLPVLGMGMSVFHVPVHKLMLHCALFDGEVRMGVRPALPVNGVTVILGNDVAGARVWADRSEPVSPILVSVPLMTEGPDESEKLCPGVFEACAMTRAMKKASESAEAQGTETEGGVMDGLMLSLSDSPISIPRSELVSEQTADPTLTELFKMVLPENEVKNLAQGYFIENGVLLRKWLPHGEGFIGDPVYQIVVPSKFRDLVLRVAHDETGHMGVRKTCDRVLRHFYWPRVKRSVAGYIKTCHTCQLTGKPNQSIKVAPLYPIPAIAKPFEHLIVDCVGPLPCAKSGAKYLLTVMCQSTRYPAAYPLRTITTKAVVRALSQFMSIFGIPRVCQSDNGSNFTSHMFAQVLQQLKIKHNKATAYHAQSQGALERFHQTLKSMLRAYCVQMGDDWEDGLPWLLLAAREVTQESLGFSPNELVFGHTVRGLLAVLQDDWKVAGPPNNLIDYVNSFRHRLYCAMELAKVKLGSAQKKMKRLYDRRAEQRIFSPGDQVLALLPIVGSPFQAKFMGPYTVVKQLTEQNYLVATPGRRKHNQLCHVNLLKPYLARESEAQSAALESAHPVCVSNTHRVTVTADSDSLCEDGLPGYDSAILTGRLKNSEMLANLESFLSHVSESQRGELVSLIREHPTLFGDVPSITHVVEHDIELIKTKPIRQRFYRVSPVKHKQLQSEIGYMLDNGIAKQSASSWASPCLLVPKSDGTARFCTDYRKVNNVTKPDSYPLPRMDDCIDQVGAAKFISKFDLLKGYWQVPLSKRAREIAAFITPSGLYSYSVMPFGLRNAPATFQRLMNKVVGDLEGCAVYLDDVVIYSDTWADHLQRIGALFKRLADARLTVNLAKCDFARATVTYLGRQVGQGEVRPVRAKVEAVEKYPPPTTKKELQGFLGFVGFFRSFCRNFSTVVAPLTDLLKGNVKYIWSPVCQRAFENAKKVLYDAPVLAAPRMDKPFKLQVDASHVGAGGVLLQEDEFGINKPVCFFSKKFNKYQLNYSVIEKEALALIWSMQHFEVYVGSGPVVVYTDHNPLTFLHSLHSPNQRLIRWTLFLQAYTLDIRHIKGKDNVIADALSRAPCN